MKIGIIGAGGIGRAFAQQVSMAGYEVIISNSRGPESLQEFVNSLGSHCKAGTVEECAAADVVFLALRWQHMQQVTTGVRNWAGKVVIDPSNPVLPGFIPADLGNKTSSETVAGWVPGARVVKAFNTYTPEILRADPKEGGGSRVIFYSGNDDAAKQTVAVIIDQIGFSGIDLGKLEEGGRLQQFPGGPLPEANLIRL